MTETKYWAFREATDSDNVSAWAIAKERDEFYGGGSTGLIYWSPHKEGYRKPVGHVYPKSIGVPFFRFIESSDGHEAGPGESLEHRLFKEAVASMTHTRLCLGTSGDHRIRVTQSETEKMIRHAGGHYAADVYLRFESETDLSMKWSGDVYIEIKKSHAVGAKKIDGVVGLRVPMIEVSIPAELLYRYGGAETTDQREDDYRRRIKHMLESPNGFLKGIVLSNPNSIEYLENLLADTQQALTAARARSATLEQNLLAADGTIAALRKESAEAVSETVRLRLSEEPLIRQSAARLSEVDHLQSKLDAATVGHLNLSTELEIAQKRSGNLQVRAESLLKTLSRTKTALGCAALVAGLSMTALMVLLWSWLGSAAAGP